MVTVSDICSRLNVTEKQVQMAIYSGALPNPNEYEEWDDNHVEFFLKAWEERIKRRKKVNEEKP